VEKRRAAAFQMRLAKCKYDNLVIQRIEANQPNTTSVCLLPLRAGKSCQLNDVHRRHYQWDTDAHVQPHIMFGRVYRGRTCVLSRSRVLADTLGYLLAGLVVENQITKDRVVGLRTTVGQPWLPRPWYMRMCAASQRIAPRTTPPTAHPRARQAPT
jgi:hypothetical protein